MAAAKIKRTFELIANGHQQKEANALARDAGLEKSARRDSRPSLYITLRIAILCVVLFLSGIVALFGCTIVFSLPLLGDWLRPVFQLLWSHQPLLVALRLILSFLILLVPTTAMGLTLPVVMKGPLLRHADFSRVIGLLYGWNTLGAVAGALLGEAYLVKAFGLGGTGLIAGLANCSAAIIAFLLAAGDRRTGNLGGAQTAPRSP